MSGVNRAMVLHLYRDHPPSTCESTPSPTANDIPSQSSPLTSPVLEHPPGSSGESGGPGMPWMSQQQQQTGHPFQHHIASLKHQQQMQQQMLLEQYHHQQLHLAQEHEKQLQEHIKEYMEQQHLLEQQQRLEIETKEKEKLNLIKNKTADEQSAIASSAVKAKLHNFVMNKKHREAGRQHSPPQFRNWMSQTGSVDHGSPPQSTLSPPYPNLLKNDDYPLRKTASEPNILKVRSALKQKVLERRVTQSPMMRRRENLKALHKRRAQMSSMSIDTGLCSSSSPESGPNSPSSSCQNSLVNGNIQSKEMYKTGGQSYPNVDGLYTSPSMPNISLGRPPKATLISQGSAGTEAVSEADLRIATATQYGIPMSGHLLQAGMPYFPTLPVIDGEIMSPTSPAYIAAQMKAMEEAQRSTTTGQQHQPTSGIIPPYSITGGITGAQAAHARLHRHRPLGRTQSAPLPLVNPLLAPQSLLLQQQSKSQDQKMYHIKQHIRNTVLQRSGSKNHMENVDEETEAKLAQPEMRDSREATSPDDSPTATAMEEHMSRDNALHQSASHLDKPHLKLRHRPGIRPLNRTQSSPLVTFSQQSEQPGVETTYTYTTGLAYDTIMMKHQCTCGNNSNHPEHAGRLQSVWARLQETGLVTRCERVKSRKATLEELQSCHSELYCLSYGTNPLSRQKLDAKLLAQSRKATLEELQSCHSELLYCLSYGTNPLSRQKFDAKLLESLPLKFCMLQCGGVGVDSDTVWNDYHTSNAARMAAGCAIELSIRVASGELKNGMAVVRPPGHHAESQQPMGFCYFNSVAVATRQLQEQLKLKRILIVDWDVHHGNATQQMFYDDDKVLYISIHRHDNGNFFPGTGSLAEMGAEEGTGFNVNIAFSGGLNPPMGDAEYLAAFRTIVMPIARHFDPEMVIVSSGFDAADGHPPPLGGYLVSPVCFSLMTKELMSLAGGKIVLVLEGGFGLMTKELMSLAGGKIVLVLEGGYELQAICDASEMCVTALVDDEIPPIKQEELERSPCKNAVDTLETVIKLHSEHWPCIERNASTVHYSLVEARKCEIEEADTVSALASLSMVTASQTNVSLSEPMEEES